MLFNPRCWLSIVAALAVSAAFAQPNEPSNKTASDPPAAPKEATPLPVEALRVPSGTVIVLYERAKDAMQLFAKWILLSPEKYQEQQDRIKQLEAQLQAPKPIYPSECRLSGRVVGNAALLRVEFLFSTDQPRSIVALGCTSGNLTSATLDGKTPAPIDAPGEEGYTVRVAAPGEHRVILELGIGLANRGAKTAEQGFEIGLPTAAITVLEQFDAPAGVAEVRCSRRLSGRARPAAEVMVLAAKRLHSSTVPRERFSLGPVEQLELAWRNPTPQATGQPLLSAEGVFQVRVDETAVTTEAELLLQGETDEWHLQVPRGTVLREPRLREDARVKSVDFTADDKSEMVIRLTQPVKELKVSLQVTQARPGPGKTLPVGPFAVLGKNLLQQKGHITITAPASLRVHYVPVGEWTRREPAPQARDDQIASLFSYWAWPPARPDHSIPPILELSIEAISSPAECHAAHELRLAGDSWKLVSHWEIRCPTGIDRLECRLPPRFKLDASACSASKEPMEIVTGESAVSLKWNDKVFQPLTVTLVGAYSLQAADERQIALELPRPLGAVERGAQATAVVPDDYELVLEGGPPTTAADRTRHRWQWVRGPEALELAWRLYRPDAAVLSVADVTLTGVQIRVRQQFRYPATGKNADLVLIQVPAALQTGARVEHAGGTALLIPNPARNGTAWAGPLTPASGAQGGAARADTLTVNYTLPMSDQVGRRLSIPLLGPADAARAETKARVWCDPGMHVELPGARGWEERPIEIVAERDSLPALVASTNRHDLPLTLALSAPEGSPLARFVADRALVSAAVTTEGFQLYRMRCWLSKLSGRHLDLDLPAPPASIKMEASLSEKRLLWQTVPANPLRVRLPLEPDLFRPPVLLDLTYEIPPSRTDGGSFLIHRLKAPVFADDFLVDHVRWSIVLPSGWLPLTTSANYVMDQRWSLQGWLFGPRPAYSGQDLEAWLAGNPDAAPARDAEPALVCRGNALEPLAVAAFPKQALWILGCSLLFLVVSLPLLLAAWPRGLVWVAAALIAVAVVSVAVAWPSVLRVVAYGCQPGICVLLGVLVLHWMLQERYRRQIVFLPGFSRVTGGSSLIRAAAAGRPREPTTVDAPAKMEGSSLSSQPRAAT